MPPEMMTGSIFKYFFVIAAKVLVRAGTTDEMTTPSISRGAAPASPANVRTCSQSSLAFLERRLCIRHSSMSRFPLKIPRTVCEFPTSTARSMGWSTLTEDRDIGRVDLPLRTVHLYEQRPVGGNSRGETPDLALSGFDRKRLPDCRGELLPLADDRVVLSGAEIGIAPLERAKKSREDCGEIELVSGFDHQ